MNENCLLIKLSSKYLIKNISSYIKDVNFIYRLMMHCKLVQKKMNFEVINYKDYYFEKKIFKAFYYKKLNNYFLSEYLRDSSRNDIAKFLRNYFKRYEENINKIFQHKNPILYKYSQEIKLMNDYFPFNILLGIKNFSSLFAIELFSYINETNKINEKLNELEDNNINYYSLKLNFETDNMSNLKKMNIYFNQLKKLTLESQTLDNFDSLYFLNKIHGLIYLKIENIIDIDVDPKFFTKINDFPLLQMLDLKNFSFTQPITIELSELKRIRFENIQNIYIKDDILSQLESLTLIYCSLIKPLKPVKCPELLTCNLIQSYKEKNYRDFIDFSSCKKLKYFFGNAEYFLLLKNQRFERIIFYYLYKFDTPQYEIKIFKKILSIPYIYKIILFLNHLSNNDFLKIEGKNITVRKLKIFWMNPYNKLLLDNLGKKFPNLFKLSISSKTSKKNVSSKIIIKENSNCNITNIKINAKNYINVEFYINSYEKLDSVKFKVSHDINLEEAFPLFNSICPIYFESLFIFHLRLYEFLLSYKIFNNLYNNIDNTPNLREFVLKCFYFEEKITDEFIGNFIKKLVHLRYIKKINFYSSKFEQKYTLKELKELFPEINFDKLYDVKISKKFLKTNKVPRFEKPYEYFFYIIIIIIILIIIKIIFGIIY